MIVRFGITLMALLVVGLAADRAVAQGRGSDSASAERTRAWALRLIERYDKNGNKMLEKEEQATLRGKPAGADLNNDGVITINELVTHLSSDNPAPARPQPDKPPQPQAQPQPTTESTPDDSPSKAYESGASKNEERKLAAAGRDEKSLPREKRLITPSGDRKSFRFKTPAERLPDGLPGWFASRDANGDGQVAMNEYSGTWSDRTAAEFVRQDLDNDGFITPQECLRGN